MRNAFTIGKDLTVTTQGWSTGYIYADLTNEGTVTTQNGSLVLNGNVIENKGVILTGDRIIYLENATVNGGILNGAGREIQLNGATVNSGTLTGTLVATGDAVTLNRITVDDKGELSIQANTVAQESLAIDGKVNVWSNKDLTNASAHPALWEQKTIGTRSPSAKT